MHILIERPCSGYNVPEKPFQHIGQGHNFMYRVPIFDSGEHLIVHVHHHMESIVGYFSSRIWPRRYPRKPARQAVMHSDAAVSRDGA
jgi:hypothetical protein